MLWLPLVLACAGNAPPDTQTEPLSPAPEIGIDEARIGQEGPWLRVPGWVDHEEQPLQELIVTLSSNLDGDLWRGHPTADGAWAWEGELGLGEHLLLARVLDGEGHSATAQATVVVETANHPPTCSITSPLDGAAFASDEPVPFHATWSDPDGDPVRLLWTSDAYGPIFQGEAWEAVLPDGAHLVTLLGEDAAEGTCVDEVEITIGAAAR